MTDIKKFKRGQRTYTRVGQFKEVRIDSPSAPIPAMSSAPAIQIDIDSRTESGVYANGAFVHRSPDEVVIDFTFVPPNAPRGRILSRIVLSPKQARVMSALLKEAADAKK